MGAQRTDYNNGNYPFHESLTDSRKNEVIPFTTASFLVQWFSDVSSPYFTTTETTLVCLRGYIGLEQVEKKIKEQPANPDLPGKKLIRVCVRAKRHSHENMKTGDQPIVV